MRYWATADWHGWLGNITDKCLADCDDSLKDDTFVCLGDAGIHYGNYNQGQIKKWLKRFGGTWVILRGNHDKRYEKYGREQGWDEQEWNGGPVFVQRKYKNIYYLPDAGGLYTINGRKVLIVPGAYSVDKEHRLRKGYPWEPDEQLTEEEAINLIGLAEKEQPEVILSHECPRSWHPYIKDLFLDFDFSEDYWTNSICQEILRVDKNIKKWYFGHYHDERRVDGIGQMVYNNRVPIVELNGEENYV